MRELFSIVLALIRPFVHSPQVKHRQWPVSFPNLGLQPSLEQPLRSRLQGRACAKKDSFPAGRALRWLLAVPLQPLRALRRNEEASRVASEVQV